MLGSLLKLNVANVSVSQPYTIPEDNPFVNDNETLSEIYAYGLRQPWRACADRGDPETGIILKIFVHIALGLMPFQTKANS